MSELFLRVLLVEDSRADAKLMVRELRRAGFDPDSKRVETEADYRAELLQLPDIILCDYNLPQFNAELALEVLRQQGLDIPLIIVSGSIGEEVAVRAIQQGATDYLLKDRLGRLGPAVKQALAQRRLRAAERETERALRQSQDMTRKILDTANDPFFAMDGDGRIIDWNVQAEAALGWPRAEALGRKMAETILPHHERDVWEHALRDYEPTGEAPFFKKRIETVVLRRDGRQFPAELTVWPVFVGTSYTFTAFVRDISERREAEASIHKYHEELERRVQERTNELEAARNELQEMNVELRKADLAKDRFLASMSHELRTPLNAIIGFTGIMLMQLPGPLTDEQKRQLHFVDVAAKHLLSLITDLLDLRRIESGAIVLQPEPVAIEALLQEVATTLRPLAEGKGLGLEVVTSKPDAVVQADRRTLTQILINLATNAIKFTDEGSVRIELDQQPDDGRLRTEIRVVDTGIGIAREDQCKLFQEFTQVNSAAARGRVGTGLGLYLSQKLAELMGGLITVHSEYGSGSTFDLTFSQ